MKFAPKAYAIFFVLCLSGLALPQDLAYDTESLKRLAALAIVAQGEFKIEKGFAVEKTLLPTQRHRFRVRLEAGQYLDLLTTQQGIHVQTRLYTADQRLVYEQWRYARPDGTSNFKQAIEQSGEYLLEIAPRHEPFNPSVGTQEKSGSYQLRVEELRAATADDLTVQKAEVNQNKVRVLAGRYLVADANERNAMTLRQEHEAAIQLGEQTLQAYQRLLPPGHVDLGNHGMSLVALYEWRGTRADRQKLEQLWEIIAQNRAEKFGPNNFHSASAYYYSCVAVADPVRGERQMSKALAIVKALGGEKSPVTVMMLGAVAGKLFEYGNVDKAREYFARAEQLAGELPDTAENAADMHVHWVEYTDFLLATGQVEAAEKNLLRAERWLSLGRQVTERTASAQGDRHGKFRKACLLLGRLYQLKKDYARAESYFRKIFEPGIAAVTPAEAGEAYRHLGNLFLELQDYGKAEQAFTQGLQFSQATYLSTVIISLLRDWSKLKAATGKVGEALELQQRAFRAAELELQYSLEHGSDAEKVKIALWSNAQLHEILALHTRFAPDAAAAFELALTALLLRKGRVQDELGQTLAAYRRMSGGVDGKLLEKLLDKQNLLARLSIRSWEKKDPESSALLSKLAQEVETLQIQLSEANKKSWAAINLELLQAKLPANSALVEYIRFTPPAEAQGQRPPERYLAYLLAADGRKQWFDLGEAAIIDRLTYQLLQSLQDAARRAATNRFARQLEALVMQPLRAHLQGVRQVLIAPDSALNLVPFAALPDERGRELVRDYLLVYLTSGRDLLRLQTASTDSREVVVFAAPDYDDGSAAAPATPAPPAEDGRRGQLSRAATTLAPFQPLPFAKAEAAEIKRQWPQARIYLGAQALEATLKQVRRPLILHLATHGMFLPDQPAETAALENPLLRSWLALAGANQRRSGPEGREDGILTAYEAAALDLWGTKLVVLSACETGLGEIKNGEGVFGLRRALALAGVETQVTSLWKIDDRITRNLMKSYYGKLRAGVGRAEALRQVQLELLNSQANRHPYYWAGFLALGEWANLAGERKAALRAVPRENGK